MGRGLVSAGTQVLKMAGVLGSCVDSLTAWSRTLDLTEILPLDCDRHSGLLLIFNIFSNLKNILH